MTEQSPRSLIPGDAVIETQRLTVRQVDTDDAEFILRLLNEPSFLQYIGDKGVRNLADARNYIDSGPKASYAKHGFGLYLVRQKSNGIAVGTCGLLKRDSFEHPDLGFAFLAEYWSLGYALEAAQLITRRVTEVLGLSRIVAVSAPDNRGSIALLTKLGFVFERTIDFPGESGKSNFYSLVLGDDVHELCQDN